MSLEKIPQHVALIMDGNGRWAGRQGLARIRGHQAGADRLEDVMRAAEKAGVKYITLYAFSKENWHRPKDEVQFLMQLLSNYLDHKLAELKKNNIVFNAIGCLTDMPSEIQAKLSRAAEETASNTGLFVTFAFSYSSRLEITEACRALARLAVQGKIDPEMISEKDVASHLYTSALPDPDLLIRTSGEMRVSNFLLWQISYAELYVTEKCWPEFTAEEFQKALAAYSLRERRFGRTEPLNTGADA
ncbi:MAG: isoprenyl transferase [Candidatus Omnitrophica bacterium]|nr:isoprenyl transferase [Candidatus Omnitrophota bacterium]